MSESGGVGAIVACRRMEDLGGNVVTAVDYEEARRWFEVGWTENGF